MSARQYSRSLLDEEAGSADNRPKSAGSETIEWGRDIPSEKLAYGRDVQADQKGKRLFSFLPFFLLLSKRSSCHIPHHDLPLLGTVSIAEDPSLFQRLVQKCCRNHKSCTIDNYLNNNHNPHGSLGCEQQSLRSTPSRSGISCEWNADSKGESTYTSRELPTDAGLDLSALVKSRPEDDKSEDESRAKGFSWGTDLADSRPSAKTK